jgi:hypothetical protein
MAPNLPFRALLSVIIASDHPGLMQPTPAAN